MSPEGRLPRLDDVSVPRSSALILRRAATAGLKRRWGLRVHHADRVPNSGPVILAPNHVGWIDGPLLVVTGLRRVAALTKIEEFHGPMGLVLRASGQIPLDRFRVDPWAVKTALKVLDTGEWWESSRKGPVDPGVRAAAPRSGLLGFGKRCSGGADGVSGHPRAWSALGFSAAQRSSIRRGVRRPCVLGAATLAAYPRGRARRDRRTCFPSARSRRRGSGTDWQATPGATPDPEEEQ
ncbi:MAG: 1-acyl-sn-glycerol-3-phosphate acyltransferase [Nocardioidaceae bacterium]|nr:MAG: 1-acyl-sn-glycerol-3-phosphate acyltransferase [Nocardioidaceae bacterium]